MTHFTTDSLQLAHELKIQHHLLLRWIDQLIRSKNFYNNSFMSHSYRDQHERICKIYLITERGEIIIRDTFEIKRG